MPILALAAGALSAGSHFSTGRSSLDDAIAKQLAFVADRERARDRLTLGQMAGGGTVQIPPWPTPTNLSDGKPERAQIIRAANEALQRVIQNAPAAALTPQPAAQAGPLDWLTQAGERALAAGQAVVSDRVAEAAQQNAQNNGTATHTSIAGFSPVEIVIGVAVVAMLAYFVTHRNS